MQCQRKLIVTHNLCRHICWSNVNYKSSFTRLSGVMGKVMHKSQPKREWVKNEYILPSVPDISLRNSKVVHNVRRSSIFNKLFMKHITDLMSTDEVAPNLLGEKCQISRVQVVHDFRSVNVYWFANDNNEDETEIEELLLKTATQLRHRLCQLNVLGNVPKIIFVKDVQYFMLTEIDKRLAIVKSEEVDESSEDELESKEEPSPETFCTKTLELSTLDGSKGDVDDAEVTFMPGMKNDILGLNHYNIMTKIKNSVEKSRNAVKGRLLNTVPPPSELSKSKSFEVAEYLTAKQEKEAFTNFLHKRNVETKKRRKREEQQRERDYVYEANENRYNPELDNRFNFSDDSETQI